MLSLLLNILYMGLWPVFGDAHSGLFPANRCLGSAIVSTAGSAAVVVSLLGAHVLLRPPRLHGPGAALHDLALVPLRAGSSLILTISFFISLKLPLPGTLPPRSVDVTPGRVSIDDV